jgi:hypothetical protein
MENQKETDLLEDTGVDEKIILQQMMHKQGVRLWAGFVFSRTGFSGGLL